MYGTSVLDFNAPSIHLTPSHVANPLANQSELENPASFNIVLQKDGMYITMVRPTGVRQLAKLDYENPNLFERLAEILSKLGFRLEL